MSSPRLVGCLLGFESFYRSACPTISIRANCMGPGHEFGWHFDTNDGVVSIILQNAELGGEFQYVPNIRDEKDENYAAVKRIFDETDAPQTVAQSAGAFVLFNGSRSLHRVSRVGQTEHRRHSLLFSYDQTPNMVFPEGIRQRMMRPSTEPFRGLQKPSSDET